MIGLGIACRCRLWALPPRRLVVGNLLSPRKRLVGDCPQRRSISVPRLSLWNTFLRSRPSAGNAAGPRPLRRPTRGKPRAGGKGLGNCRRAWRPNATTHTRARQGALASALSARHRRRFEGALRGQRPRRANETGGAHRCQGGDKPASGVNDRHRPSRSSARAGSQLRAAGEVVPHERMVPAKGFWFAPAAGQRYPSASAASITRSASTLPLCHQDRRISCAPRWQRRSFASG